MGNILEIKNLGKAFPGFLLNDVSFSLPKGYIMGFIGPNGAGKTTTIKSILGLVNKDAGEINLFGQAAGENADMQRIGVVMDQPFYVGDWTIIDVEKALSPFYTRWDSARFGQLLRDFDIDDPKKAVKDLSRGMKVKLMVAVALSHSAELLILDEPTSGLDPVARDELMDILLGFMSDENRGVLFSTHITSDLDKIADYVTFIRSGEIVYTGEKDILVDSYRMVKGGLSDISAEQKRLVLGIREHGTGFEGLVRETDLSKFGGDLLEDPVDLEQIVVFLNQEDR